MENVQVPIIEFKGVDVINGNIPVLEDVSFTIMEGEFVYLLGKVGSGKTSIIRSLIGENPIKKGEATICGFNLRKLKKREIPYLRRKVGVIFQDFKLLMDRSVEANLEFVLRATGWKNRMEINHRIEEVLESVGMKHKAYKMPHQLSGGEQQRVAIARALLNNPKVILADEPTGNLDPQTTMGIMELLHNINQTNKPTILLITHNQEVHSRFPSRTLICENQKCHEYKTEIEIDFSELN